MRDIKGYWDARAKMTTGPSKTTNDVFLRQIEVSIIAAELSKVQPAADPMVLDVGCGDGRTVFALAERFPSLTFRGVDFSSEMIASARNTLYSQSFGLDQRITFSLGDVRDLHAVIGEKKFWAIISNRCLINLATSDEQYLALQQIAAHLAPEGVFLGTENFVGGQNALNQLRRSMRLPEIPIRWHNLFFEENEFISRTQDIFREVKLINFSSTYYYVTRVVYSALCHLQGQEPDYEHPIYEVAIRLPPFGDFSPIKLIRASV
jgi:SAM-dependent methyltransferase